MNPAQAEQALKKKIIRYLDRSLPVKGNMPEDMRRKFETFQTEKGKAGMDFVRPPYLEVTQAYQTSLYTLQNLVEREELEPEVADAFATYFGGTTEDIRPYDHQYQSLIAVDGPEKNNLVVCTGTGSGKTECFLLPLINAIYRQHKQAKEVGTEYKKHIRAMILYPMNALVNDQLNRLRRILKNLPEITFGRYTGETEQELDSLFLDDDQMRTFNDSWGQLPQYDASKSVSEESSLPNEYLDRARWAEGGGADILVTNYAMLERLMLMPDNHFFDCCWDFIVLDEAHSYTGSTGTEIAWLMRRLERRLRNEQHGPIQFLATSATLSSNPDKDVQKGAAEEFARKIFPLGKRPIHIEFGRKCDSLDETGATPLPNQHVADFRREQDDLYKETIDLELRRVRWKANKTNIKLLQTIDGEGRLPAKFLFDLAWLFDFPNRQTTNLPEDILVDTSISFLAKLVLARSPDREDWRDFLHDESLPGGTALPNDRDSEGKPQVKGNRLHILENWKKLIHEEACPHAIDFDTFYYLYLAANDIVQNNDAMDYDIPRLMVQLTEERWGHFKSILEKDHLEDNAIQQAEKDVDNKWRSILPVKDEDKGYGLLLYQSLVTHPEIQKFMQLTANEPKAFDELAQNMDFNGEAQEDLRGLLELGALALNPVTRRPLIDVRYHQVVRHIADIGVYFKDGDIGRPIFVRNQEEYAPDGEKVFTLGVCRYCGQPYLLGYASGILGNEEQANRILRAKTPANRFMHAFSWLGEDVELSEEEKKNIVPNVYLNLKTGDVSFARREGEGWLQTKAMLKPCGDARKSQVQSFIPKCVVCNEQQNQIGTYGIITPYEATGEYYKLAVLGAFAEFSDGDTDPQKEGKVPANGRKILVFSDSRPNAARLAQSFENLVETRLMDKMVMELVESYQSGNTPENQQLYLSIQSLIENGYELPVNTIEDLENDLKTLECRMEDGNSTMSSLLFSKNEEEKRRQEKRERRRASAAKGKLYEKLNSPEVQYTQLLDYEDENKVLVRDLLAVSKFRILQALRNGTRHNLLGEELLTVTSRAIEKTSNDDWARLGGALGVDGGVAKEIARRVYVYLVRNVRVDFDETQSKFVSGPDRLDQRWRDTIKLSNFRHNRKRNPILKIAKDVLAEKQVEIDGKVISNWLGERLWRKFKADGDGWDVLQLAIKSDKKKSGATKTKSAKGRKRTSNIQSATQEDEYALDFGRLCDDMRLNLGNNINEEARKDVRDVLPLVIQEHTAQIDANMGAIYQRLFTDGKVNILSCSTTFEMGVDVGGLNNVFLANLPPASANYRQRAGRAGRRPGAAAYILSLAGESLHDQNFYENVKELFWGEIQPPEIYLRQPYYAARHFRAEGLHDFFAYLQECGKTDKDIAAQWRKISCFILGRRSTYTKENGKIKDRKVLQLDYTCCSRYLGAWQEARREELDRFLESLDGFASLKFDQSGRKYSVTEDLVFQLGFSELPTENQEAEYNYYRNLGGCRVPEWDNENETMQDGSSPKRWGLQQRLEARFEQLKQQEGAEATNAASPAQIHLMNEQTIDILSETCILPRYGFPTDIIELIPAKQEKATYARGVKMQRRLEQGLFEYAPGQTVVCNKRCFPSYRAGVSAWPGDKGYGSSLAGKMSESTLYCGVCKKVYNRNEAHGNGNLCPVCGCGLSSKKYITPEVFFAGKSDRKRVGPQKRSPAVVHWSGKLIGKQMVPGWKITTGESSDRMLQYINPGKDDEGFPASTKENDSNAGQRYYYVHEVQTNIAIWQMGGGETLRTFWGYDERRVKNAYLSALYALRRSIAKELNIATRDLGCLLKQNLETGSYDFVFFDKAVGGGGWALALAMQSEDDTATAARIERVVTAAIKSLGKCECKCDMEVENPAQLTPDEQKRRPVTLSEFKSKDANGRKKVRPTVACYKCLKDYDNQSEQSVLDRWDALRVLELQRGGATVEASDNRWEPFTEPLTFGRTYLLKNGEERTYDNWNPTFTADEVAMQEKD